MRDLKTHSFLQNDLQEEKNLQRSESEKKSLFFERQTRFTDSEKLKSVEEIVSSLREQERPEHLLLQALGRDSFSLESKKDPPSLSEILFFHEELKAGFVS